VVVALMADIPTPPAPRPYRVHLEVDGAKEWVSVWGYDLHEAVLAAMISLQHRVGGEGMSVCAVTPDFEAYVRMARGKVTADDL
jgi:hypothetical protein